MLFISLIRIRSGITFRTKTIIKKTASLLFSSLGYKISYNSINELIISKNLNKTLSKIKIAENLNYVDKIDNLSFKTFIINNSKYLHEQRSALWTLFLLDNKRNGYFVEFGACDGLLDSNTLLLEKSFGWKGILAEPNRAYRNKISENRESIIDRRAIWSRTKDYVEFAEVSAGGLSGIYSSFRGSKNHKNLLNKRELL